MTGEISSFEGTAIIIRYCTCAINAIFLQDMEKAARATNPRGKKEKSKIIEVPCGTIVYDADTGEFLYDITEHGQEVILLKGGKGGLGNARFKSATNQAPRYAQPGEPSEERWIILELKLLADVGW